MKRRILILVFIMTMLFGTLFVFTGCGVQKYKEKQKKIVEENKTSSSTNKHEELDLSEFESYGGFLGNTDEDQVTWVCKADYNGRRYGYINRKGEYVVPLSEDILVNAGKTGSEKLNGWMNNMIVVSTANQGIIIYDTKGNIVTQYKDAGGYHKAKYLGGNGNILMQTTDLYPRTYMYIASKNEIIKLDYDKRIECKTYSENLLCCVLEKSLIIYLDEEANEVLKINSSSNSAYMAVMDATSFENGKATITFQGKDYKSYNVTIDKTGKWLDEPVKISDSTGY